MPTHTKRRKKKKQGDRLAIALVCVFVAITVFAGAAALLLRRNQEALPPDQTQTDEPQDQQPENNEDPSAQKPETNIPDNTPDEENPENPDGEELSNGEEGEPISEEDLPVAFNKPDVMRGVVVKAGTDFLTDPAKDEAGQQGEIDKMLDQAQNYKMNTVLVDLLDEDGSVFSVDSIQSRSNFDGLDYLLTTARGRGMFVYGIYDLSYYGKGGEIRQASLRNTAYVNRVEEAFADFAKKYQLDGVLLEGCENPSGQGTYEDYMAHGAGRTYEEYMVDNSRMMVESAKAIVAKYSRNTQVGLLTDAVWATKAVDESGVEIPAETEGYKATRLDSKTLMEDQTVDFVAVKNFTATGDTNAPFETIAKWWDGLAAETQLPVYMVHAADRACTTELSPGWAAHDQLTRQMIALENCGNLQGSVYNALSNLTANPKDSTTLLMNYFSNNVKKEHILKELAFSKPTQLNISTTDKTYTFQGASDPNSPVTVNGEALDTDENGFFSYTVKLEPGDNKYTFNHKEKTMTFTITRQVQVLKEVTPAGSMSVDGGMKVAITAIAYENSSVMATINGQNIPLSVDDTSGDEELRGTSYRRYVGSFTAPKGGKQAQHLGNIVVSATWEGITKTMEGASVTVNKLAVVEDGVLVRVTADQAIVFPVDQLGKYPTPSCYRLPKGTLDYAVGEEVVYKDGSDVRKYYKLASGMRVYSSDIAAVSDDDLIVAGNVISGLTVKADKKYTYVILKSEQPVPFQPAYSSTKFQIDFKYTTGVPEDLNLSKNPLFSSATWNDSTLTLGLKAQGGFLGYKAYHDDGAIVFRFNNPTSISGARIVVDPGHGGGDNGAAGFNPNFQEKDINWAVAKRLASKLEKKGANVLLLETINQTTSMDSRLAQAQNFNAQVFISVHHNSASSNATGPEAYYFYPFAQSLASRVSAAISGALNSNNRGARYDVFYVTRDPQFVGILSEGGFITNRKEYNKLIDDDYQDEIASAMADAIASFLKNAGASNAGITGTESTGDKVTEVPDAPPSGNTEQPKDDDDKEKESAITAIKLKDTALTLDLGGTYDLQYKLTPEDASDEDLDWESSDPSIVKVNSYGKIRADKAGTATITVSAGDVSASCKVTVKGETAQQGDEISVTGVQITNAPDTMEVGETIQLKAKIAPGNASNTEVEWELASSSRDYARLSRDGELKALEEGTITLRVKTADGGYTDVVKIAIE